MTKKVGTQLRPFRLQRWNVSGSHLVGYRNIIGPLTIGLVSPFYLAVGGQLYIAEIVSLFMLPLVVRTYSTYSKFIIPLIMLSVLYISGLIISAIVNGSSPSSLLTNVVSIFVFSISICAILCTCSSYGSFVALFVGIALGGLVACIIQPNEFFFGSPWKFGYSIPVTLLGVIVASRLRILVWRTIVLILLAAMNILGDFRSLAIILVVIAGMQFWLSARAKSDTNKSAVGAILGLVAIGSFAGLLLAQIYTFLVSAGILGKAASIRLQLQGGGSPILMLLGGRNEVFYSIPAALDNPILGYGSQPMSPGWITENGRETLFQLGLSTLANAAPVNGVLPTHSFLMGGWIEAGVFGLTFWLWILLVACRSVIVLFRKTERDTIVTTFMVILMIWNLFYSPFGGTTRFVTSATVAFLVFIYTQSRKNEQMLSKVE